MTVTKVCAECGREFVQAGPPKAEQTVCSWACRLVQTWEKGLW